MYKFICLIAFASSAYAASVGSVASVASVSATTEKREIVPLLRFETDKQPDGSFSFSYEGGDKSFRQESGTVTNAGTEDEALEVSGSYRYIDADGQLVEVHYTAGKNGFVPVGSNILPEISSLAKAAADLPDYPEEQQIRRRGRAQTKEPENIPVIVSTVQKKVEPVEKKAEPVPKKVASVEKTEKVEQAEKPVAAVEKPSAKA